MMRECTSDNKVCYGSETLCYFKIVVFEISYFIYNFCQVFFCYFLFFGKFHVITNFMCSNKSRHMDTTSIIFSYLLVLNFQVK